MNPMGPNIHFTGGRFGIRSTNVELYSRKGAVKTGNIDQNQYLDSEEYEDLNGEKIISAKEGIAVHNEQTVSANGGFEAGILQRRNLDSPVALPEVEVFPYDSPLCRSTQGRVPQNRDLVFAPGRIGSELNPWFKERRWTVPKGLVAAYTMNAGVGSVLRDDSGNFNDATITNAAWNASGKNGYCLYFDGTGDYVTVKSNGSGTQFAVQNFTIAGWVKRNTTSNYTILWSFDYTSHATPYYAQHIRIDGNGNVYFGYNIAGSLEVTQSGAGDFPADTDWHHVVVTFTSGSQKIYVDNVEVASETDAGAITYYAQEIWIGNSNFEETKECYIDEVRFYNRVLTSDERAALYAETSPYTDVNSAPCDNAIWCGKTTTNLVATTDLADSKWGHDGAYQLAGYGNVFDPDLLKTVFKWTKGSTAGQTYIYDPDGLSSPAAGAYVLSLMVKCNYAVNVEGYFYNATPGTLISGAQTVPADTWTLCTFRITTAVTTYTELGFFVRPPGGGNFASDIEFRACDPYVALESYPMPFAPTTRPAASLWYNYDWPQQGTVGFWCKPGFTWNVGGSKYLISDFSGATYDIRIGYDASSDKFFVAIDGSTSVLIYSTAITSNADLQKWWMIAVTYDVVGDSLKLYCYNADYPSGDNASSTSNLGTVAFNNYLEVGAIPLFSTPAGNEADSLIAGLFIDDTVWTEAELLKHYQRGRSYTSGRRIPYNSNGMFFEDGDGQINGKLEFGDQDHAKRIVIDGKTGNLTALGCYQNTTATAANMAVLSTGQILRSTSSRKYKTQVEDIAKAYVDEVLQLRPVWYRSLCKVDNPGWSYFGLIAEEVAKIDPRLVQFREGERGLIPEGVDYVRVFMLLLKSYQEYVKRNEDWKLGVEKKVEDIWQLTLKIRENVIFPERKIEDVKKEGEEWLIEKTI